MKKTINGSDTKYRDIADGNYLTMLSANFFATSSDTKYRDIADGNVIPNTQDGAWAKLETKYRDIADGNYQGNSSYTSFAARVRYQVPRYSGWKH